MLSLGRYFPNPLSLVISSPGLVPLTYPRCGGTYKNMMTTGTPCGQNQTQTMVTNLPRYIGRPYWSRQIRLLQVQQQRRRRQKQQKGNGRVILSIDFHRRCYFGFCTRHNNGADIKTEEGKNMKQARDQVRGRQGSIEMTGMGRNMRRWKIFRSALLLRSISTRSILPPLPPP